MSDPREKVIAVIRSRVQALGPGSTSAQRQAVYDVFQARIDEGIAAGKFKPDAVAVLKEAIRQIERDLAFEEFLETANAKPAVEQEVEPGARAAEASAPDVAPVSDSAPPVEDPAATPAPEPVTPPPAATGKRGALKLALAAAAVAAIVAAGFYYQYGASRPPALVAVPLVPVIPEGAKPVDLTKLTTDAAATKPALAARAIAKEGEGVVVAERTGLYSSELLPVDPTRRYELSIRMKLRSAKGATQPVNHWIGVATFDKAGKLIRSKPDTHRYALMNNEPIARDDWVEEKVVMTGTGDARSDQFPAGTASVRFVMRAQPNLEIARITWRELPD